MRAQGLLLFEPVSENRKQAATDTKHQPSPVIMTASFLSSLDSCEEVPTTMSSECTLGCALFMWLASVVDVPVEPLHANKAPHGCIFPYLETSTEHRTEHFLMGGSNCCIPFHTHEFLFLFPVGGATMVTVARFLFFCPRASEQRVSHTEVVGLR